MRSCSGRTELFNGTVTNMAQCRKTCDERFRCVSYEWWDIDNPHPTHGVNFCQASSSCTYENSEESTFSDPTDLYVKGDKNEI